VYPNTETDDRVGRDKKRKDNGKEFSFSYHETLLCHLCSEEIPEKIIFVSMFRSSRL
jgi:hypothetical protein